MVKNILLACVLTAAGGYLLGSILFRAGKYSEAEVELRKAVTLKPDYAEGWNFLGEYLQARGKEKEAQEAFKKARQFAR